MQSEIHRVLKLKSFFNIISSDSVTTKYSLRESSRMILNNIYYQWLSSIWQKTDKHFPIVMTKSETQVKFEPKTIPIGYTKNIMQPYQDDYVVVHNTSDFLPKQRSTLMLNILMSETDIMQYFLQWQRYRKFWWSSVSILCY